MAEGQGTPRHRGKEPGQEERQETQMTNAERITELKGKIFDTGVKLQELSRAAADAELIADVLTAANGDSSEADAHFKRAEWNRRYRSELLRNLRMMHSELAGFGIEA